MSIKQLSVFIENKPGALQHLTGILGENNIDMRAFSLVETEDYGIARIIADNVLQAATLLKDEDYVCYITPVLAVAIPDTPGGLHSVLGALSENQINIEYMYAFLGGKSSDQAYMIFRVANTEKAAAALAARGIRLVSQKDIEKL